MKKQPAVYITVITLLAVVCCFVVYKAFSGGYFSKKENGSEILFECVPDEINKIVIENSTGKYSIVKEEKWIVDELRDKDLVEDAIISTVNTFTRVFGKETEAAPKALSFSIKATVITDKEEFSFSLSQEADKYYLKTDDGKIYEDSQVWYKVVEKDMNYYRNNKLNDITSLTEEGENKFVSYNYKPSAEQSNLREITVRTKNSDEVMRYDTSSPYILEKPYLRNIDKNAFESKVLSNIPNIRADKFISDAAENFEIYGLDEESRGELTVKYDDKTFKLLIGGDAGGGAVYAAVDGEKSVFTVVKSWLDLINSESFDFVDKALCSYNPSYIKGAEILMNEQKIKISSSNGKFYVNGKPVSDETFKSFKTEITKVKIKNLAAKPDGKEYMRIIIFGKDGYTSNYILYKTDDGKYTVSENDIYYFGIDEVSAEEFKEYAEKLENALI